MSYEKNQRMTSKLQISILGLIVTGLALVFIFTQINLTLLVEALLSARYEYLILCILLLLVGLGTRALRWSAILNSNLGYRRIFHIMNIAYLVNGVLPLRIGEVSRMYLASQGKGGVHPLYSASTIIVERLLDLVAVAFMLGLALSAGTAPDELKAAGNVTAVLTTFGLLVILFITHFHNAIEHVSDRTLQSLPSAQHERVLTWIRQFLRGLRPLTNHSVLVRSVFWTGISWVFSIAAGYVLMLAFFDEASLATTALFISAAALAIAVPAVPGNIGTYEASILLALFAMGYEQSSVTLAFAITVHAVNVFVHAGTGVVGFIAEGISLTQLRLGVSTLNSNSSSGLKLYDNKGSEASD